MMPSATLLRLLPLAITLAASLAAGKDADCCAARASVTSAGSASTQVAQNITTVQVGVDIGGPTASDVQVAVADAVAAVVDYLAAQGGAVRKVKTFGSRLSPQYDYDYENYMGRGEPPKTFREYTASGEVSFELIDISSTVLDGLAELPSVTVDYISQSAPDDSVDGAKLIAVEKAIAAARVKAKRMAAALGKKLGDPISVNDSVGRSFNPYGSAYDSIDMAGVSGGRPTGLRTVYAEAVVEYALL